jgi:flagellar hook-associated protein 3 FlgL
MRVTQSEMYRTFASNIHNLNEDLAGVNSQMSSGKKLNDLADSPSGSADLVTITDQALKVDMYHSNIEAGTYHMKAAESALNEANNLFSSIQALGSQAISDATNPDSRAAMVEQLRSYRDQMIALGNSQPDGYYLFAGTKVNADPFEISGDQVIYNGNDEINTVPIGNGVEVAQGVSGSAAFGSVFNTIDGLLANLDSNDIEGTKASLTQFAAAFKDLEQARGSIGTNLTIMQNMSGVLDSQKMLLTERKSNIEDANMVDATLRLSQLKTALDGALSAGGSILKQSNLFDILG